MEDDEPNPFDEATKSKDKKTSKYGNPFDRMSGSGDDQDNEAEEEEEREAES
jgi:hypothetical protein